MKSRRSGETLPVQSGKLDNLCRSYRKQRRGASAVEFAMVAPVFFLLVFGMIEYGRMVMVQQVITNASREGARRAILDGATSSDVKSVVNSYLQSGSISGANVTINPAEPNAATNGSPITVTVRIGFDQVSWLPSPMFLGETNLSATTVMRRESAN